MNLLGYAKTNQKTFNESMFSCVDALLVSWLSYFDFDEIKDKLPIQLKEIIDIPYYHKLEPYKGSFLAKTSRKIMNAVACSRRFQNARSLRLHKRPVWLRQALEPYGLPPGLFRPRL